VSRDSLPQREKVAELVNQTYVFLGIPKSVRPDDLIVHDEYYRPGYAIPNDADLLAIELLARTEGLLIDPVYTGKAFAGLIDLLRKGQLDDAEAVLFFHTGGSPAVFAMPETFQSHGGGGY
jgi:D-cysteine desulfhydrase